MNFCKLNNKYFWWFVFGFLISTIIGTQTHEYGHILVAKILGYETTLSYGSMSYNVQGFSEDEEVKAWRRMFENDNKYEHFSEAEKQKANQLYKNIQKKFPNNPENDFYVTLGGPSQTIVTCFIGLFIIAYRSRTKHENFTLLDWIAVFLSLFVLREVFNTIMAATSYLLYGSNNFGGDEFHISMYLGFNIWTIPIMTAILGAIIASFVIFMIIPKRYRCTFIFAGFVGSISGFIIWFKYLGPWLFQ